MTPAPIDRQANWILVVTIAVAAVSGLLYELVAGALASYLLGDSITQFSLVIGFFLSSMGVGAWTSQHIPGQGRSLVHWLVGVEIAVGLVGGTGALVGFFAFAFTALYQPVLLLSILSVGFLVGLEIPLVLRILKERGALRITVANILAADYLGALVASVLFPFVLLPHLGLVRAGLLAGLANVAVGLILSFALQAEPASLSAVDGERQTKRQPRGRLRQLRAFGALAMGSLLVLFLFAGELTSVVEDVLYRDHIIVAENSRYQRVVMTKNKADTRLYLNGHLQFSTVDEHRYHESLVHPALAAAIANLPERPVARVLILGGGDGMTAREVLKYESVQSIDLVDLDPIVTDLFSSRKSLVDLNHGALKNPRVKVHNLDAMRFLERSRAAWDVILMDLPDPSDIGLAKLYSTAFFKLCRLHLAPGGVLATQATNPFRAREAFWTIVRTLESVKFSDQGRQGIRQQGFYVHPYQSFIPTFGAWGFVLASTRPVVVGDLKIVTENRYLSPAVLPGMFVFPPDIDRHGDAISTLDDPQVVSLYQRGYHDYLD